SYRRALRELRRILERRLVEPRRRKQCEVRGVPEIRPVRNIPLTHRGLEPRRLRHNPVREEPAAAAARDAYPRFIYVALLPHFVHTRHQILVVVARVVELNDVPELLAIVGTAARIRVEDDIALRSHPLELVREGVAVGAVRAAMNFEDQR